MRGYEASRARLRRDRIDILYAHDLGRMTHGEAHPHHFCQFLDGGYKAMRALRDAGAVRAIGIGVNEIAICEQVLAHADLDLILLAGRYTLLEQDSLQTLLPLCARRSVGVVIGGPYNSGRSEEHTSELQSLMRISYAVFCLKKNNTHTQKMQ